MLKIIDRKRMLVPVPWAIATMQATILGMLPNPVLTKDQVLLLKTDNVVSHAAQQAGTTFAALGLQPQSIASVLPTYLWRYRPAGQFTRHTEA